HGGKRLAEERLARPGPAGHHRHWMSESGPEGVLLFGIQATRLGDAAEELFSRLAEHWRERPAHALSESFSDPLLDPAQGHRGQQRLSSPTFHHKLAPHVQGAPQALV